MDNPIYVWDFTLPQKYCEDVEILKECLNENCKKWCFQLEEGKKTGLLHYQGRFSLNDKKRLNEVKRLFGNAFHFSPTNNKSKDDVNYVTKEDTRIAGPWQHDDPKIPRQLKDIKLYPWQQHIVNDSRIYNDRIINVIIDNKGNIGKSIITSYIIAHKLGQELPILNNYKDVMQFACSLPATKLYIIDIPRSMFGNELRNLWGAVESIKNGRLFETRYKARTKLIDPPNIWIFSNTVPDLSLLSRDRWRFWRVTEEQELTEYII